MGVAPSTNERAADRVFFVSVVHLMKLLLSFWKN